MNDGKSDSDERTPRSDPLGDLDEAEALLADLGEEPGDEPVTLRQQAEAWSDALAFKALSEVACSITGDLEFKSLVAQILDVALDSLGAERGIVFMGGSSDDDLIPVVARAIGGKDIKDIERVSATILSSGRLGDTIFTSDAASDERFRDVPSVRLKEIRTVMCLPMTMRDEILGVIYVDSPSQSNAFSEHSKRFMSAFAGLAAVALQNANLHGDIKRENLRLRKRLDSLESFGRIVTTDPGMLSIVRKASQIGQVDAPVMLLGESGTGKELMARSVHEAGPRSLNPFVAYNCAAVPGDLMESIFFGYVKGAFTGANRDAPGLFRLADRGTLFLDEIADLGLELQGKLLRVLENGMLRPIGSDREIEVDIRLITATSRELEQRVREGTFREDLFYRINVLEVRVPPLRDRIDDLPILVHHFIDKHASSMGANGTEPTQSCLQYLQTLPWRGNVRELENFVRRMLVLADQSRVGPEEAQRLLSRLSLDPTRRLDGADIVRDVGGSAATAPSRSIATDAATTPTPGVVSSGSTVVGPAAGTAPLSLEDQERQAIIDALTRSGGNKSKAARLLGLHRNSLLRRMARLKIVWME